VNELRDPASPLTIPFNRPTLGDRELALIAEAARSGHLSGDGMFTKRCHEYLERLTGCHKALLTTSCTHALEMGALLLRLQPGDEVIVPSFTFVSTANAFALHGARLVFADIRPDTLNLDERLLPALITPRTRAIVVVHYAGVACEMDAILGVAREQGITVIEDNAHGLFGTYRGKPLGSFGALATQSFHETKNISCGEGGALIINEVAYAERAEILREKGTDRSRFFRGQVDKYTWVDLGSSYLPSEILAAVLYGQFEQAEVTQARRQTIWERYDRELAAWAETNGFRRPMVPQYCTQAWHMYYLLAPDLQTRTLFISRLRDRGVLAVFHYQPLHASPMGKQLGGAEAHCPVTCDVADRLVRLPFYNSMTEAEQTAVIEAVTSLNF
jgi:dTDP-4-amino-4,6-dideoxygalactose transaminase